MSSSSGHRSSPVKESSAASDGCEGSWIGIDLGTTNCACAVWDSTRGRPKLLQLKYVSEASAAASTAVSTAVSTAASTGTYELARPRKGKVGRIVPSVVLIGEGDESVSQSTILGLPSQQKQKQKQKQKVLIGMEALMRLENSEQSKMNETARASITSIKRLIGQNDEHFLTSLPFDIVKQDDGTITLNIHPINSPTTVIQVTPLQVIALLLHSIRLSANAYLQKNIPAKKKLQVPGSSPLASNCVIGVPAHFGLQQKNLIQQAARIAGFDGHVSTIAESTAASMAYGLFVSVPAPKHVLVLDIGGGTTDLTLVQLRPDQQVRVLATVGDPKLGGDDMDEAIMKLVLQKNYHQQHATTTTSMTKQQQRSLLLSCRKGKESLCGTEENPPTQTCAIRFNQQEVIISQQEFNNTIQPLLHRLSHLINRALTRLHDHDQHDHNQHDNYHYTGTVNEVVLVGGATRVPAVRLLIQKQFPNIPELCSSLNPEGAVAQGAAIQAAIRSGMVPLSELKSALMLDALPHTIGVLDTSGNTYIPVLHKDAQLPAMGSATFTLASPTQPGVTVVAVEDTGDALEEIGEFTFLLRKLKNPPPQRRIDIGMTMETSGKFIVSIFDENDPEHIRKKKRYQQQKKGGQLGFDDTAKDTAAVDDEGISKVLLVTCVALFLMYIVVKISFNEIQAETPQVKLDEFGIVIND